MKAKIYKLYENGVRLEDPDLMLEDSEIYTLELYEIVCAIHDGGMISLKDMRISRIDATGFYVKGIEEIDLINYRQEWLIVP